MGWIWAAGGGGKEVASFSFGSESERGGEGGRWKASSEKVEGGEEEVEFEGGKRKEGGPGSTIEEWAEGNIGSVELEWE